MAGMAGTDSVKNMRFLLLCICFPDMSTENAAVCLNNNNLFFSEYFIVLLQDFNGKSTLIIATVY
jgi:hypothetical protein